ncbi:integrase core domain-containing protein [Leptospira andrefontaineae]|uniref:integrase core domain-containing protein n=1 Tax=Leptospira andrefontaineae TaxID=2484976 RepID=UPI001ABFEA29|nr:integrase core domain-containing protein [Leptospira andrefontaineae]
MKYKKILPIINRLTLENPNWGYQWIQSELQYLGIDIPLTTLRRIILRIKPLPPKIEILRKRWKTFLKNQTAHIAAMDFLTIKCFGFTTLYCFFIIEHHSRRVLHFNLTFQPSAEWMIRQLKDTFPFQSNIQYLILDNDSMFNQAVLNSMIQLGISPIRTSIKSPWQNAFAERWIGSVRKDLLNHIIVFGENHARSLLKEYVQYYNKMRPHQGLDGDTPTGRIVSSRASPEIPLQSHPVLNGLIHFYDWKKEAA